MEKKNILIGTIAIVVGLLLGYLLFGGSSAQHSDDDGHNHSAKANENVIWTCSMHPEIKMEEAGDCPKCGMDLIPLESNLSGNPLVLEMSEDAIKISNIQTTIIGNSNQTDTENSISLSGKIKANESTSASVVTHIPGRIEKLYVSFTGERVRKGQKIATIYAPNLISAQKELLEAQKIKDINPALFEASKNKLKFWKITDKQIDQILTEEKIKEFFSIYADHSGVVIKKRVSVGDHLMEGGVLFDIQNLNKLWVVFDVYEKDLSKLKKGNTITFTTPSVPDKIYTSKVSFIDPFINPKTRAGTVRLEISNSKQELMPEMFVTGQLSVSKSENASTTLSVPKSAVLWTGERSVVYVKLQDTKLPSFEFREVTLGTSTDDSFTVVSGLKSGDEVVTNGAFIIDASAQLNNQMSMMNRNVNVETESAMKCEAGKCEAGKCGSGM